jgi:uncharacterized protein (TIGR01777 family)
MKIILAGGTGHIGRFLSQVYRERGDEVIILSRKAGKGVITWDGKSDGAWQNVIDGADVVINLAGRTVDCRYTRVNLKAMMNSRVDSTLAIGRAITNSKNPPQLWLQMSTATIYAHRFDAANDEKTGIIGGQEKNAPKYWAYSIEIAKNWEKALFEVKTPKTRKIALRSSMVMSPIKGSVFGVLSTMTRLGLGGNIAGGKQYISWIHQTDFVSALNFLIEHVEIDGPINLCAPNPIPQKDFMSILRSKWNIPIGLPAFKWMTQIGAFLLRTDTELILKSRRVVPQRLLDAGFQFQFANWSEAAENLVQEYKKA